MKRFLILLLIIGATLVLELQAANAEVVDKILVVVNDEIITQGDVDRILLPIYAQYRDVYSGQELVDQMDQVRLGVLDRMIQDKVLLSEARRREVKVDDREVSEKIEEVRKTFPSEEEFKKALRSENLLMSDIETKYRQRIMIDRLVDIEIKRRVSVSPSEVVDFFARNADKFGEPDKIKLRAILIRVNDDHSEEDAIKIARQIVERLNEGSNFALLAARYSDGPYAESGGDMGWVNNGELMERINGLVFTLEKGEISGILKTDLGFHIFMVEEKEVARPKEFKEAKKEIEGILYNQKIQEELGRWLEDLKKDAYIAFR